MSKSAVSVQERDSVKNVTKSSAVRPNSSFSFLYPARLSLKPASNPISNLVKPLIQPKLKIGAPNDKYEQEADRVADQVMRMPEAGAVQTQASSPQIQRTCPECEEELQRQPQPTPLQINPLANTITPLVQRQEEPEEEEEEVQPGSDQEPEEPTPILDSLPTGDADELGKEDEEELVQAKPLANTITPMIQRQSEPEEEEEEVQPGSDQEPEEPTPILDSVPTGDADELGREDEEEFVQAKSNTGNVPRVTSGIARNINSLKGSGQPLPKSERTFFEPRFGTDFSNVRMHNDTRAASTARSINARAFTLGRDIVFGAGQYSPDTHSGRKLLAHELTHVLQQQSNIAKKALDSKPATSLPETNDKDGPRLKSGLVITPKRRVGGDTILRDKKKLTEADSLIGLFDDKNKHPKHKTDKVNRTSEDVTDKELKIAIAFNKKIYNTKSIDIIHTHIGNPVSFAGTKKICKWQEKQGLRIDGQMGPNSLARLVNQLLKKSVKPEIYNEKSDAIKLVVDAWGYRVSKVHSIVYHPGIAKAYEVDLSTRAIRLGRPAVKNYRSLKANIQAAISEVNSYQIKKKPPAPNWKLPFPPRWKTPEGELSPRDKFIWGSLEGKEYRRKKKVLVRRHYFFDEGRDSVIFGCKTSKGQWANKNKSKYSTKLLQMMSKLIGNGLYCPSRSEAEKDEKESSRFALVKKLYRYLHYSEGTKTPAMEKELKRYNNWSVSAEGKDSDRFLRGLRKFGYHNDNKSLLLSRIFKAVGHNQYDLAEDSVPYYEIHAKLKKRLVREKRKRVASNLPEVIRSVIDHPCFLDLNPKMQKVLKKWKSKKLKTAPLNEANDIYVTRNNVLTVTKNPTGESVPHIQFLGQCRPLLRKAIMAGKDTKYLCGIFEGVHDEISLGLATWRGKKRSYATKQKRFKKLTRMLVRQTKKANSVLSVYLK